MGHFPTLAQTPSTRGRANSPPGAGARRGDRLTSRAPTGVTRAPVRSPRHGSRALPMKTSDECPKRQGAGQGGSSDDVSEKTWWLSSN
jgi:hypothetical protein